MPISSLKATTDQSKDFTIKCNRRIKSTKAFKCVLVIERRHKEEPLENRVDQGRRRSTKLTSTAMDISYLFHTSKAEHLFPVPRDTNQGLERKTHMKTMLLFWTNLYRKGSFLTTYMFREETRRRGRSETRDRRHGRRSGSEGRQGGWANRFDGRRMAVERKDSGREETGSSCRSRWRGTYQAIARRGRRRASAHFRTRQGQRRSRSARSGRLRP